MEKENIGHNTCKTSGKSGGKPKEEQVICKTEAKA